MRGINDSQDGMFSYISPEQRVPKDHPLRPIREMVNRALSEMWPKLEGIVVSDSLCMGHSRFNDAYLTLR